MILRFSLKIRHGSGEEVAASLPGAVHHSPSHLTRMGSVYPDGK